MHSRFERRLRAVALATLTLLPIAASAATAFGEHLAVSGFGTLGFVRSDTDEARYVREQQARGAGKSFTPYVDSNLGLKVDAKAADWLTGTLQAVTEQRVSPELTTRIDWAFVAVKPLDGLVLRAGRLELPSFLVSDSRKVGYANNWLRPPNEVYGLDLLNGGLKGGDVTYRLPLSAGHTLSINALGGKSKITASEATAGGFIDVSEVRGLNVTWEGDWYSLRVGRVQGSPALAPFVWALLGLPASTKEVYSFTGYGATAEYGGVVFQAEYVTRRTRHLDSVVAADGWYAMAGYRFGSLLPYALHARKTAAAGSSQTPQRTTALGLRWDASSAAALKVQVERVDTRGTIGQSFLFQPAPGVTPGLTHPASTVSVAADFVF